MQTCSPALKFTSFDYFYRNHQFVFIIVFYSITVYLFVYLFMEYSAKLKVKKSELRALDECGIKSRLSLMLKVNQVETT